MNKKLLLDDYILDLIWKRKKDLELLELEKGDYSIGDYNCLWHRYHGTIDDLYMCLTAYNNPLSMIDKQIILKKIADVKKKQSKKK